MDEYRHGAFADPVEGQDYTAPAGVGTIPVYIGRGPVHQLESFADKTNIPILLTSYRDACKKIGHSKDWTKFELCEAVEAHFKNRVHSAGPIIVINALNPMDKKNEEKQTATIEFVRKAAVLPKPMIILSSITMEGKSPGEDYSAEYSADGESVLFRDLKGTMTGEITVSYYETDPLAVTETDLVTAINKGVPRVYYDIAEVPTLLCAPGWSHKPTVFSALVEMQNKINGHWYAYLNADLDSSSAKTIDAAITAKDSMEAASASCSVLWPMALKGGKRYHASTLNTVTMQWVDLLNGNVPFETPSNKQADMDALCLADGTPLHFDQTEANRLNAAGIDTMTYWEGAWRMWGPHTMKFKYGQSVSERDIFDCNVRMQQYIGNTFQRRYGLEVDKPMTRGRKDAILNDFQAWLDGLIRDGALITGTVQFLESDNPVSDLVQGDFVFDTEFTNPIPGKSLSTNTRWSRDGLTTLYGGDKNA